MANTIKGSSELNKVHPISTTRTQQITIPETSNPASSPTQTGELKISKTLESIQALSAALAEGSSIDKVRVDAIRQSIEAGEYTIDSNQVAKKFIELEKMLKKFT